MNYKAAHPQMDVKGGKKTSKRLIVQNESYERPPTSRCPVCKVCHDGECFD